MKKTSTRQLKHTVLATYLCFASVTGQGAEPEIRTDLSDQTSVAVTIYNENLALVKDARNVALDPGLNRLAFRGVSARMRPETALLRSLGDSGKLDMLEQNFDFDLLTPQKLLEKYVGESIRIASMNPATGEETIEEAVVLSTNNGVVLRIGDRIETNPGGRYIFDRVPENLRDKPTLVIQLENSVTGAQPVELSYLTGGLSWKADYVAELNPADDRLDLLGWVTLNNVSGATYTNARLQLVAGDVNQVREQLPVMAKMARSEMVMADAGANMQEEGLFEYHLYTLNRPTTIADNQTKQVSLLTAANIPVTKQFLLEGSDYYYRSSYGDIGQKIKIGVFVKFRNDEESGLGLPLPKGIVRVYKKDSAGNAQFVGEDRIDHTPKKEDIKLKLGDAFDITASKKQTDFQKRNAFGQYNHAFESAYEIELKNAKSEAVTVVVREPVPGDWKMIEESSEHRKVASGTAEWHISIPPESSITHSYRVLVRY